MKYTSWPSALILLACVGLAACDDDEIAAPSVDEVAGEYLGIRFTATGEGWSEDLIEDGAEVVIVLHEDSTMTGHLYIPGGLPGGPIERDLAGVWAIDGTSIDLDHDSFLAGMRFRWRGDGLIEGELEGGVTYELRLARVETGSP